MLGKGERFHDWAWVGIHDTAPGQHSQLIRRGSTGELTFYRCWTLHPVRLATLIRGAGTRWIAEETFRIAKGHVSLDQYQCHGWIPWRRFTVLAMLALAILTLTTAMLAAPVPGLIALTVPEVRRLINATHAPSQTSAYCCDGRSGDADINPKPVPATTDDENSTSCSS